MKTTALGILTIVATLSNVGIQLLNGGAPDFVGAFAAALNSGNEFRTALEFAIKFATNSVSKKGAQSSYPTDLKII